MYPYKPSMYFYRLYTHNNFPVPQGRTHND